MSIARVAGRYAKSLIDLASETGRIGDVVADMKNFNAACHNRDLTMMLRSPIIPPDKKQKVVTALFGSMYSDMTLKFFKICIDKSREALLPEIASEFLEQYKLMEGVTTIHITSAAPLSPENLEAIRLKMQQSHDTLKTVDVITSVDPSLIGGFVVEFGDKIYDDSVAHKLELLRKQFKDNPYQKQIFA